MSTPAVSPSRNGEGAEELRSLARLALFLATYFLEGPDEERHRILSDPEWLAAMERSGLLATRPAGRTATLAEHRRRFEALLRIPGDDFVPPFEQGYHEQKATVEFSAPGACQQVYRRAGYALEPYAAVQPDHVGHQLRFLSALLEKYADRLDEGDDHGAAVVKTWIRGFVNDRCWWWPQLADRLLEAGLPLELEGAARLLAGLEAAARELAGEAEA